MIERTLSIIKPDAVKQNVIGQIINVFEQHGLRVLALKTLHLTPTQAHGFYQEHHGKPFFDALVTFMTSGPIVVQVLEGDHAIAKNRELLGSTNPADAAPGTLRAMFAASVTENAVHGSDSETSAVREINYFFSDDPLIN